MARLSSKERVCIRENRMICSKAGCFSRPRFSASVDMARLRAHAFASWRRMGGDIFGWNALATFSNSARVMLVLQSSACLLVPAQTPFMVSTVSSGATILDGACCPVPGAVGVAGGAAVWAQEMAANKKTHRNHEKRMHCTPDLFGINRSIILACDGACP